MGINYVAVLVAALSGFAIGAIWYGPLFGRHWMAAAGPLPEEPPRVNVPGIYGLTFVLSLLAAVILELVIHQVHAESALAGARISSLLWLGFVLTVRVTEALFNGTNMRLVMIDSGYRLIWLVVMGVILAAWR